MRKSILILLLLVLACETPFDPKIDENSQIVVNSFFRPDAPFTVNLTTSNYILNDPGDLNPLSGALVTISSADGIFDELTYRGNGNYLGDRIVESSRNFSLNVKAEGFQDLNATDVIPERIAVSRFEVDRNLRAINLDDIGYPATITFNDPIDETNYYALETIVLDVSNPNNRGNFLAGDVGEVFFEDTDVTIVQNVDIEIGPDSFGSIVSYPTLYFDDVGFSQETNEIQFFISPLSLHPDVFDDHEIYVVLKSVSEAYYEFLRTTDFQREVIDLGVPAEPVQINSNIENGLGIFGGYNFSILQGTIME